MNSNPEPQQVTAEELAAVRGQLISHSGDIREACAAAGIAPGRVGQFTRILMREITATRAKAPKRRWR